MSSRLTPDTVGDSRTTPKRLRLPFRDGGLDFEWNLPQGPRNSSTSCDPTHTGRHTGSPPRRRDTRTQGQMG